MAKSMDVDGGCLCGHVTYAAAVNPAAVAICNCTDCQNHSGSAFSVFVPLEEADFRLKTGELSHYEKVGGSGTLRAMGFCPKCGTLIYGKTVGQGMRWMSLRVGTIRQRAALKPGRQIWYGSAQTWTDDMAELPKFDKQPSFDDFAAQTED
jgi:hypothetical protein